MTPQELRLFAFAAIDDPDARIVLDDAFRDVEDIVGFRVTADAVYLWFLEDDEATMKAIHLDPRVPSRIATEPTHAWLASALTAVLLFGEWPEVWELAKEIDYPDDWWD